MSTTRSWSAWSCTVRVVVSGEREIEDACDILRARMSEVDAAANRFRPDSALSIANSRAGRPTPIPALLVDLIDTALTAAQATAGAVDPTLGRVLTALGYDRDIALIRDRDTSAPSAGQPTPRLASWRNVVLDRAAGLLTVPAGASLDLGATAKARTADLVATDIHRRRGTSVLVEIGGDVSVRLAPGAPGFGVRVAEFEGGPGAGVTVYDGGLATSTTTLRRWRHNGVDVHHLLDPATARPTRGPWRTATVAAATCVAANTASTAAIVLGAAAPEWLESRALAARLIDLDGAVVTTSPWPQRLAS